MAVGSLGDYEVSDPIREYQELSATIEARYSEEIKVAEKPVQPLLAPPSDEPVPQPLQGDDYQLDSPGRLPQAAGVP